MAVRCRLCPLVCLAALIVARVFGLRFGEFDVDTSFSVESCSCVLGGPVLLLSHRGEYLQSDGNLRLQMTRSHEDPGAQWNIVDVGTGKFTLKNSLNLTLQDVPVAERQHRNAAAKSLFVDHVDQPGIWEQWNIVSDSMSGQDCSEVIITSLQNRYLQDNNGIPLLSGNPGAWERWKIKSSSGKSPCGISFIETAEEVHLGDCPMFYQTAEGVDMNQSITRHTIVRDMMNKYSQIRKMSSIYHARDWDVVTSLFRTSRLPVNLSAMGDCGKYCIKKHSKGHIAKWASLIMGIAWQLRFQQPCMVLLEDDVTLPDDFWTRMATLVPQLRASEPFLLKFGQFGEGYLLSLKAARVFLHRVYEVGINEHSDVWTDRNLNGYVHQVDVGSSLNVVTGGGNIWRTPDAAQSDFEYHESHDPANLEILTRGFDARDEFARSVDLVAVASQVAKLQ